MKPQDVVAKYFSTTPDEIRQLGGGAINTTYFLKLENERYILQKMNRIFNPVMMEDLEFITNYLRAKGVKSQEVKRTLQGNLSVQDGASWWRVLTYIPGEIFHDLTAEWQAREAGRAVGEFHKALQGCDYKFKFTLSNYHDLTSDMGKFRSTLEKYQNTDKYLKLEELSEKIISSYEKLPKMPTLPERIIHNDLKVSNIVFDKEREKVTALIDFDPITRGTIDVELGDALRSWCMPQGEDAEKVVFKKEFYDAALEGYFSVIEFLTEEEKQSIPLGVKRMTLALAARFVTDAFEENYFALDSSKYENLFEQNKKRAENQLSFFQEFSKSF